MSNAYFITATVTEVNEKEATATVQSLHDENDIATYELQILQRTALGNKSYALPDVNDTVLCLLLDIEGVAGFILGAFYTDDNTPPVSDKNIFTKVFKDGSKIAFDTASGDLTAEIKGNADIKIDGDLKADIKGDASIKASKVKIEADSITLGGDGALKLVNETHPCSFTGTPHSVPSGNTRITTAG